MRPGTWGLGTFTNITQTLHTLLTIGRALSWVPAALHPKHQALCIRLSYADCLLELQGQKKFALKHSLEPNLVPLINLSTVHKRERDRKVSSCCLTCCYLLFIVVRGVETMCQSLRVGASPEPGPGGRPRPGWVRRGLASDDNTAPLVPGLATLCLGGASVVTTHHTLLTTSVLTTPEPQVPLLRPPGQGSISGRSSSVLTPVSGPERSLRVLCVVTICGESPVSVQCHLSGLRTREHVTSKQCSDLCNPENDE